MAPHIGLNLLFLVPDETGGMEVYARHLIESLTRLRPDLRLTAFINRNAAARRGEWNELVPSVTVPVDSRNRAAWVLADQLALPPVAARKRIDLLHSPANLAPALGGRYRRILTVHDLIHRTFPEAHAGFRARALSVVMPLGIRRSHRLIAISKATRDDLVNLLHEPPEKIDVIPQGLGEAHPELALGERELRDWLGVNGQRPIALSVSAKRPHKNLPRLLEALARIPGERRPLLVIPGYRTWHEEELREQARRLGIADDVRLLGWVSQAQLEGLYAGSKLFVLPSLFEGFGLPVLEAMQRGLPVACSNRSSLPEVAGDAALLFDPERPDEIGAAITRLIEDASEAERLRAAGLEQARRFTWDETARLTAESYERALSR
jgi:glycosyltransferase involved in cell wall biosynthesis